MQIQFLGEAIHGAREFTRYRHSWLEQHAGDGTVVVFEADRVGLLHSVQNHEDAVAMLQNFPRVQRTREMAGLLGCLLDRGIPVYGADVVTRNSRAIFSGHLADLRRQQVEDEERIYSSPDCFTLRDAYMADAFADLVARFPEHRFVGLFHNLHIKRQGSLEIETLRLQSVAQNLCEKHGLSVHATALLARQGSAFHNNLESFNFLIDDVEAIENLEHNVQGPLLIPDLERVGEKVAYHHAFERETLPVRDQYDACIIFPEVTPPHLIPEAL